MRLIMDSHTTVLLDLKGEMLQTHSMYKIQIQGVLFFLSSQLLSTDKIKREQKIDGQFRTT